MAGIGPVRCSAALASKPQAPRGAALGATLETAGCRGWGAVSGEHKAASTTTSPAHFGIMVTGGRLRCSPRASRSGAFGIFGGHLTSNRHFERPIKKRLFHNLEANFLFLGSIGRSSQPRKGSDHSPYELLIAQGRVRNSFDSGRISPCLEDLHLNWHTV